MSYEKLPIELTKNGLFCLWKKEVRNEKTTKIPYRISGKKAKCNEKSSFSPFEDVISHLEGYDGIGVGIFDDLAGVDIDNCIDEVGELSERAKKIVSMMNSYTEKSPSGKGIRILFKAKDFIFDKDKYYIKNSAIKVEVYIAGSTSRFLTITGNAINELGLEDRGNEIQAVLDEFMVRPNENHADISKVRENIVITPIPIVGDDFFPPLSDEEVISQASASKKSDKFIRLFEGLYEDDYSSQSEADLALCSILAFWTKKNKNQMDRIFRQSALYREKWDRDDYGKATIEKAVKECKNVYDPLKADVVTVSRHSKKIIEGY